MKNKGNKVFLKEQFQTGGGAIVLKE